MLDACEQTAGVAGGLQPARHRPPSSNERVSAIAERVGRTPAQVLLRWCVERDPVLPKSTRRERIEENAQIFDFDLAGEDMAPLDALDDRWNRRARESKWWRS